MVIDERFALTATVDVLRAIAAGTGPERSVLALGYAGWDAGQLDAEIQGNGWLLAPADPEIVFDRDNESQVAARHAQDRRRPARCCRAPPGTPEARRSPRGPNSGGDALLHRAGGEVALRRAHARAELDVGAEIVQRHLGPGQGASAPSAR